MSTDLNQRFKLERQKCETRKWSAKNARSSLAFFLCTLYFCISVAPLKCAVKYSLLVANSPVVLRAESHRCGDVFSTSSSTAVHRLATVTHWRGGRPTQLLFLRCRLHAAHSQSTTTSSSPGTTAPPGRSRTERVFTRRPSTLCRRDADALGPTWPVAGGHLQQRGRMAQAAAAGGTQGCWWRARSAALHPGEVRFVGKDQRRKTGSNIITCGCARPPERSSSQTTASKCGGTVRECDTIFSIARRHRCNYSRSRSRKPSSQSFTPTRNPCCRWMRRMLQSDCETGGGDSNIELCVWITARGDDVFFCLEAAACAAASISNRTEAWRDDKTESMPTPRATSPVSVSSSSSSAAAAEAAGERYCT